MLHDLPATTSDSIPRAQQLRRAPSQGFPEDLTAVTEAELQILDSQIKRQLDWEITNQGEPNPETEFRLWELDAEFGSRSAVPDAALEAAEGQPADR